MIPRRTIAATVGALMMAIFVPIALADGGGGGGPDIQQAATQIADIVQNANVECNVKPSDDGGTINITCTAVNNTTVIQQICQVEVQKLNGDFACNVINTNVPVPGPQGDAGAAGAQGPQGPPGRDGLTFLPQVVPNGATCQFGGVVFVAYYSNGTPVLDSNGNEFTRGSVCNGTPDVQCPNMGVMKYLNAHQISVMTGIIRVKATNPRHQTVCVTQKQLDAWYPKNAK